MLSRKTAFKIFFIFAQERTRVVQLSGHRLTQSSCPQGLSKAPSPAGPTSWVHRGPGPLSGPICFPCPHLLAGTWALVSHKKCQVHSTL